MGRPPAEEWDVCRGRAPSRAAPALSETLPRNAHRHSRICVWDLINVLCPGSLRSERLLLFNLIAFYRGLLCARQQPYGYPKRYLMERLLCAKQVCYELFSLAEFIEYLLYSRYRCSDRILIDIY